MSRGRPSGRVLAFLAAASLWLGAAALRAQPAAPAFTAAEREWMAQHPTIRVGHDPTYAPYAFFDARGKLVGIDPTYLERIARATGLKFVNETRPTWTQTMDDFRAGRLDMLMSLGYTPEREAYVAYSEAYAYSPGVLVVRDEAGFIFSPDDVNGRAVACPKDYAGLQRDLLQAAPKVRIIDYDNMADSLRAVSRGEVEAAISDLAVSAYLVKKMGLTNVRLGGVFAEASGNYMGVRKELAPLAGIINKVLAAIPPEERRQINNRWVPMEQGGGRGWILAFKVAASLAVIALLVFLLVVLHNRRLARELAERRRIQAELEVTRDRLAEASQEKSDLVSMVVHDLRSPLTGIMLGADHIHTLPGGAPQPVASSVDRIRESAQIMTRLLNELLAVQRIEAGRMELSFQPVDAVEIVHGVIRAQQDQAARKGIRIEFRGPALAPLETAAGALQQVVDNLLSNALKYSPSGTRVLLTVESDGTRCLLGVEDEGPGVKQQEREKIFARYGRGSARPTGGEGSTGLGLWIARKLVTGLGGRVWCEDGAERGARFVVELPAKPVGAAA